MTPTLQFEPALTEELRDRLARLWFDVSQAGGAIGFTTETSLHEVRADVDAYCHKFATREFHLLTATKGASLIAGCVFVRNSLAIQSHFMTLKRFMVHPSEQGTGVGRWMADESLRIAREQLDVEELHVTVRSGSGSERFWSYCGFVHVATIPRVVKLNDSDYRDSLYMVHPLLDGG